MNNKRKFNIFIMVLLTFLFLFANIYAVRKIIRYGSEMYFYDKLLVAYRVGSEKGLKEELNRMPAQDKTGLGIKIAQDMKKELSGIGDPEKFLSNIIDRKKNEVNLFRRLRSLSFGLILIVFLARVILRSLL